jgi:hypothetical protein
VFKSKFIEILKSFSPAELKEFKDFVRSPFHNKNKNVIKMYDLVRKYAPGFENKKLAKGAVYKKLFPGKTYNDAVIRILISDLIRLAEEYISYSRFQRDPLEESMLVIKEMRDRKLHSLFEKAYKEAESRLNLRNITSQNLLLDKMRLERERVEHNIYNDRQKLNSCHQQNFGEYLISYFLINLFELRHDLHVQKDLYNANFEFDMISTFFRSFDFDTYIRYLKDNSFKYYYIVNLYYQMHMADMFPDEDKYYYEFRKELESNLDKLSKSEKQSLYLKLESLIIQKIERGNREYYSDLLELYRILLKHGLYKEEGDPFMRVEMFRNIMFTGLFLKDFEWTEKFISEYVNELTTEHRDNMYYLSLANLYFAKKEFEKALENIIKVNYQLFVLKADVKVITLKIYFELKQIESAISAADTFSKFVLNNRNISELFKDRYLSFLKFYRRLLGIYNENGPLEKIEFLRKQILQSAEVLSKSWLLEKLSEFTH